MPSLQIPYALTNNKLPVSPQVAQKGQDFSCPICDSKVVLRRGDIRQFCSIYVLEKVIRSQSR